MGEIFDVTERWHLSDVWYGDSIRRRLASILDKRRDDVLVYPHTKPDRTETISIPMYELGYSTKRRISLKLHY